MTASFDVQQFIADKTRELAATIQGTVLVAVSGGVDSLTSALLLREAGVDTRLLFIDSGYQREGEPKDVFAFFQSQGFTIDLVDAQDTFYAATFQSDTPAGKRDAFRNVYFSLLLAYVKGHNISYIAQGSQFHALTTQIAHNAPTEELLASDCELIEPILGITKNNVRAIAKALGAPQEAYSRMSFPGPGLLIRFSGKPTLEKIATISRATKIIDTMIANESQLLLHAYQVFPFLLSGAQIPYIDASEQKASGDIMIIRSLQQHVGEDTILYAPLRLTDELQDEIVKKMMELPGIARVVFDMTPKQGIGSNVKPGASIEYS